MNYRRHISGLNEKTIIEHIVLLFDGNRVIVNSSLTNQVYFFDDFCKTWVDSKGFGLEFEVVNVEVVAVEGDWNSDEAKFAVGEKLFGRWFNIRRGGFTLVVRVNFKSSKLIDVMREMKGSKLCSKSESVGITCVLDIRNCVWHRFMKEVELFGWKQKQFLSNGHIGNTVEHKVRTKKLLIIMWMMWKNKFSVGFQEVLDNLRY